jgi:hypothetical protein
MTRHSVLTVLLVCLLAASAATVHAVGNERFPSIRRLGRPDPEQRRPVDPHRPRGWRGVAAQHPGSGRDLR